MTETGADPTAPSDAKVPSAQRTIILHDSGDVTLLVGSGEAHQPILVSSSVLRLASPVWRAMFDKHWAESETSEIPFPDDDVDAILLVLRIAHLDFYHLPPRHGLPLSALLNLAIVCDKYDLVKVVRPFLDLNDWAELFMNTRNPDWLFIAWTFGYEESFEILAKRLACTLYIDQDGTMRDEDGLEVESHMPSDILESILSVREDMLSSMLESCYKILDKVLASECQVQKNAVECRSMMLGSFIGELIVFGLYPVRQSGNTITISVQSLQTMLQGLKIRTYTTNDYGEIASYTRQMSHCQIFPNDQQNYLGHGEYPHSRCGDLIGLEEMAEKTNSEIRSPMLDSHRRHMGLQAMK